MTNLYVKACLNDLPGLDCIVESFILSSYREVSLLTSSVSLSELEAGALNNALNDLNLVLKDMYIKTM